MKFHKKKYFIAAMFFWDTLRYTSRKKMLEFRSRQIWLDQIRLFKSDKI